MSPTSSAAFLGCSFPARWFASSRSTCALRLLVQECACSFRRRCAERNRRLSRRAWECSFERSWSVGRWANDARDRLNGPGLAQAERSCSCLGRVRRSRRTASMQKTSGRAMRDSVVRAKGMLGLRQRDLTSPGCQTPFLDRQVSAGGSYLAVPTATFASFATTPELREVRAARRQE